jgi:peptide/nickel transport system substrate-binding protein
MKRLLVFVLLLFIAVPALAQDSGDTLLLAQPPGGDISTLNPALATDGHSIVVIGFLFDGLFQANPETAAPEPMLATWTESEDGLTYTFTLRDDANWSDGTPITSSDVLFIYNAILNDAVPSPRKADLELIAALNIIDDKTFEVVLSAPNCTVWGGAFASLTPVPSHLYAADFSDFVDNPNNLNPTVTSGPYVMDEYLPGEYVRLARNSSYYGGEPQIPFQIHRVVADTAVQNQALLAGEVDYAFMYPDQLEQLGDTSNFNVFVAPLNNTPLFVLNWADPANPQPAYDEAGNLVEQTPNVFFSDVRVRQAIAMGYDKSAIVGTLGENGGFLLDGPFTPGFSWARNPDVGPYMYDPEAAAALLDEAGWVLNPDTGVREKDGVPFEFDLVYSPLVDLWSNIALVAQDQLGQLGIRVNVQSMEWSAYLNDVLLPQAFDATIVGFGGGTQVDGIAYNILYSQNDVPGSGFNLTSYVNPEIDALLDQARSLPGCAQEERAAIYGEVQRIAQEDVAYDFTVGTNQVNVMNRRVENFNPGTWNTFPNIPALSISQ